MVNPRVGQIVYYVLESGEKRPMLVVVTELEQIGGYVFLKPGDDGTATTRWVWAIMAQAETLFTVTTKPGNWYYPFPEL